MTTFTQDDQRLLDDLNYRKAHSLWVDEEEARTTKLALLTDLAAVFTRAAIEPIGEAAAASRSALEESDPTIAEMLGNIETVMGFSGMHVVAFLERLKTPAPEPVAPAAVEADAE
jgi:hypothetical protein